MKPSKLPNNPLKAFSRLTPLLACLVFAHCFANDAQNLTDLSPEAQGKRLGWTPNPEAGQCAGQFTPYHFSAEAKKQRKGTIQLHSNAPVTLRPHGESEITGPVSITQRGRRMLAHHAMIGRNGHGQINSVRLDGGVQIDTAHERFIADHVELTLDPQHHVATEVLYRIQSPGHGSLSAWGEAKRVIMLDHAHFEIDRGTYSTCPPGSDGWQLHSHELDINNESGRGEAWHSWLTIHDIPIFYFPYINFPIDKRRKSGFLIPDLSQSSVDGTTIRTPIYWNIAPNADATFTPIWIQKRGMALNNNMRYLGHRSTGRLDVHMIPHDDRFEAFKNAAEATYGRTTQTIPYLNALNGDSITRYFYRWQDRRQWNQHWQSLINWQAVSDDYYLQDFNVDGLSSTSTQIPREAKLTYEATHLGVALDWMDYQNLHTINRTEVAQPYNRLPSLAVNGDIPLQEALPLQLTYRANATRFMRSNDFITDAASIEGDRLAFKPQALITWMNAPITLSTTLIANQISDRLHHQGSLPETPQVLVPQYRMDALAHLYKRVHLLGQHYTSTLEPHMAYLYTPFRTQTDLPVFDSDLPIFSTGQVFANNRFSGDDRVGDTNQISLGLSSRLLNDDQQNELMHMAVGGIVYFNNRRVCLDATCSSTERRLNAHHLSPIAASLHYQMPHHWEINSQFAYEPNHTIMENAQLTLDYARDRYHLITLGYEFSKDGDENPDATDESSNLSRIRTSVYWPIGHTDRWQSIASWYYNISHRVLDTALLGFEYNSCCWAIRTVFSRHLLYENSTTGNGFENKLSLVLNLKGLSSVSMHDPSSLLDNAFSHFNHRVGD